MKILVVEDEKKVRDFIRQALEQAGMVVDTAGHRADLLSLLCTSSYNVIVLDRLLEGWDSLEILDEIRTRQPQSKTLLLSALSDVEEKVKGLSLGADDYLGKPFHVSELIARIHVLNRRGTEKRCTSKATQLIYQDLKIDLEKQKIFRGERKISLTKKEFQILVLLARNPVMVFSKSKILDQVWDLNHFPES